MTLTEFLLARIATDLEWARRQERAAIRTHHVGRRGPHLPDHYSRVLAKCEANRRVVELHQPPTGDSHLRQRCDVDGDIVPCQTLRLLALSYGDHPDYRPEWRP